MLFPITILKLGTVGNTFMGDKLYPYYLQSHKELPKTMKVTVVMKVGDIIKVAVLPC